MQKKFIFLLISLWLFQSRASQEELSGLNEFAVSPQWLRLMYYEKEGQGHQSLVTHPDYFFSEKGERDPYLELKASLAAFREPISKEKLHPQCRLPARYSLLKKVFRLTADVPCSQYEQWISSYAPDGLNIVYTSQFITNPASVFGHAFVLVPSRRQSKGLWLSFNMAAQIPKEANGLEYAYGGITGWFEGNYSVMPYYQRLHTYSKIEDRDLWSYRIRLNQKEKEFALKHFWELIHTTSFKYYFFDRNCAGFIIKSLSVVLPDLAALPQPSSYVHPIDILRQLDQLNRLEDINFTPSQSYLVKKQIQRLSSKQRTIFYQAISGEALSDSLDGGTSEALIEYFSLLKLKNSGELPREHRPMEAQAFVARSKSRIKPFEPKKPNLMAQPHKAHSSMSLEMGTARIDTGSTVELSYRFAIHDHMDPSAGFLSNSTIEGLKVDLSLLKSNIWIRQLTIAKIENFQPYSSISPQPSWRFETAIKEDLLTPSLTDSYYSTDIGAGVSLGTESLLAYGLLLAELNYGAREYLGQELLGAEIGVMAQQQKNKAHLSVQFLDALFESEKAHLLRLQLDLSHHLSGSWMVLLRGNWSFLEDHPQSAVYRNEIRLRHYF